MHFNPPQPMSDSIPILNADRLLIDGARLNPSPFKVTSRLRWALQVSE
jgi:hypothetical protein